MSLSNPKYPNWHEALSGQIDQKIYLMPVYGDSATRPR